jgi:molybdopterin converting factor small subunit
VSEAFSVRVLLYGRCREAAGTAEMMVSLPPGGVVGDLVERLSAESVVGFGMESVAVAVNRKLASRDHALDPSDEVAVIPPVAGG